MSKATSPLELEVKLKRLELTITKLLNSVLGVKFIPLAIILTLFLINQLSKLLDKTPNIFVKSAGLIFDTSIQVCSFIIAFSFFWLFMSSKQRLIYQFITLVTCWFYFCYSSFGYIPSELIRFILYLSFPLQIISSYFLVSNFKLTKYKWLAYYAYFLIFFALWTITIIFLKRANPLYLYVFWPQKSFLVFIATTLFYFFYQQSDAKNSVILYSPQVFHGVLWPEGTKPIDSNLADKSLLWWNGFLKILIGSTAILFKIIVIRLSLFFDESIVVNSLVAYFSLVLSISGYANTLTGLIRIHGIEIKDAVNYHWLANSISDFFRRSAVYQYLFNLRFVYLPILKKSKSKNFAILISFITLLLYKTSYVDFLSLSDASSDKKKLLQFFVFFVYTIIIFIFSNIIFEKIKSKKWINNWSYVFSTHALLLGICFLTVLTVQLGG